MADRAFEPMSVGQIIDGTFSIYRRNLVRFLAIVAVIQVPIAVLSFVARFLVQRETLTAIAAQDAAAATVGLLSTGAVLLVGVFFTVVGHTLCSGALIKSVSECYLGNEMTISQAYRAVLPRLLTLIVAVILVALIVVLGLMVCIVPGIILGLWFALVTPAIVLENLGVIRGMGRSKMLTSGNLGKVFLVGLVVGLITTIASSVIALPGTALAAAVARQSWAAQQVISQPFSLVANVLTMPIGAIAYILLYYDLRIRKEGFDLEMLAKSLATRGTP